MPSDDALRARPARQHSETIHDLRNLFGIVASAGHGLERDPGPAQRLVLVEAIEDAAMRGSTLTSELLGAYPATAHATACDIGERLVRLEPMARALTGLRATLDVAISDAHAVVRLVPADFDAAILELIANATTAGASRIVLRCRRVGRRLWVTVADNGPGMPVCGAARHDRGDGARGRGLARVRHFATAAHGQFLLRSRPAAGTTITMILPTVLKLGGGRPRAPSRGRSLQHKDMDHEDRHSAAA